MKRIGTGGLAAAALVALLAALPAKEDPRPLTLAAPPLSSPLLALAAPKLQRVNPATLRVRGRGLQVGWADAWTFAPDRSRLALVTHANPNGQGAARIRVVDVATLRSAWSLPFDGWARSLLWRGDRLVALGGDCCSTGSSVVVVDTAARRVIDRTRIDDAVVVADRSAEALVLVTAPRNAIGPARLVVIATDGTMRSVALARVTAGSSRPTESTADPLGTQRVPGLAVDRDANRAYVISADGPVADVDLTTLAVGYHDLRRPESLLARAGGWLQPAAQAKGVTGPYRYARWLGDGWIAVSGSDETATRVGDRMEMAMRPAGLQLVDVRDWTVRTLDGGASGFAVADGLLLATGGSYLSDAATHDGIGLTAYGADAKLRFRVLSGLRAYIAAVFRGRAYVAGDDGTGFHVVDLASGRVVGRRSGDLPALLLGD